MDEYLDFLRGSAGELSVSDAGLVEARELCGGQLGQLQPNDSKTTERFKFGLPPRFSAG